MVQKRTNAGKAVFALGVLILPLSLGIGIGYWVSDAEWRWLPTTFGALTLLLLVALVLMFAGSYLTGPGIDGAPKRKRLMALGALAFMALLIRGGIYYASRPTDLVLKSDAEFLKTARQDAQHLEEYVAAMRSAHSQIAFAAVKGETPLGPTREEALIAAWTAFSDAAFATDQIRRYYEDYYRFDLSRLERRKHLISFLLTYRAELSLFEYGRSVISAVEASSDAEKTLNVPRPQMHLGPDAFASARSEFAGLSDATRILAGRRYLQYMSKLHEAPDVASTLGFGALMERVGEASARAGSVLVTVDAVRHDFAPFERKAKHFTFPVQKEVAEWMGDTRVRRAGDYLIDEEKIAWFLKKVAPGDILLARKNWYLSNIGLPGFWPHALLFVGTNEALAEAFDADPAVIAWVTEASHGKQATFTAMLAAEFPEAWRERMGTDEVLIEAISEGVSQSSLGHAAGDYVAALRPELPALQKAQAVRRAFSYLGRPYDFDFDFATDHALVCTELVHRSYRAGDPDTKMHFEPVRVAGRFTLPANEIARFFRDQGEPKMLSFVAYIEGREHHQDSVIGDEAGFAATVDRSKWDFGQP